MKLLNAFIMALTASSLVAGCDNNNGSSPTPPTPAPVLVAPTPTRTIIMVWDGLRPDDVNATDTPNLAALRAAGTNFSDNHSTYPTFTMMNSSSFATGSFPSSSGFYGNTFWTPPQGAANTIPVGLSAAGAPQDYVDPVFTEDYQVLTTLNTYYGGQLLLVKNLFGAAQAAGMVTATIGKSGAAYLQDLGQGGFFLDENSVRPRSLVDELQAVNIALPANVVRDNNYVASPVVLSATNGSPTARAGYVTFPTTAYDPAGLLTVAARDSSDTTQGAPEDAANKYMMNVFVNYILTNKKPMLSLIWFRTPDNVEHGYGPGTANVRAGLRSQDARLGELMAGLKALGYDKNTNIIVVSDHGHSTVSGPLALYPLRGITPSPTPPNGPLVNGSTSGTSAATLAAASMSGFSFSGDVRSADLLTYRGFNAYDGSGCSTSAMYGLSTTGTPTIPVKADATGALCGAVGTKYQSVSSTLPVPIASFKVPAPGTLPANGIVVAANGGSDYFYVPGHDPAIILALVKFLQTREEYGAIFVDSRYGPLPGTLAMKQVNLEDAARQNNGQPDVVVSFAWDDSVTVQGKNGIEFESYGGQRGMHGSFGTTDVHNTLIGSGPSFASAVITTPSGNVDVAPTVAYLLGLSLPQADGRVLNEALTSPATRSVPTFTTAIVNPSAPATGLVFEVPTDPTGVTKDVALTGGSYTINLRVKDLSVDGKSYRYFDSAQAVRK